MHCSPFFEFDYPFRTFNLSILDVLDTTLCDKVC